MHTMQNVQNMQNSLLLTERTSALWAVYGYFFPRSSKIPPSSHHPMFSTSWLGFPARVNQGWRGQNSKLWSSPFLWCFCKKKQKETCSRPLNLNSSRKKNRMHRKLIGSILYKQSCTAQKQAIKRAKLKHVFKRPLHIAFFKDDQHAVHMISLFVC